MKMVSVALPSRIYLQTEQWRKPSSLAQPATIMELTKYNEAIKNGQSEED